MDNLSALPRLPGHHAPRPLLLVCALALLVCARIQPLAWGETSISALLDLSLPALMEVRVASAQSTATPAAGTGDGGRPVVSEPERSGAAPATGSSRP